MSMWELVCLEHLRLRAAHKFKHDIVGVKKPKGQEETVKAPSMLHDVSRRS